MKTLKICSDNQGTLALAHDDVSNERAKHIDIKYHFIRDHVQSGNVDLVYVKSELMVADIMTKPLGRQKHYLFVKMMGMLGTDT